MAHYSAKLVALFVCATTPAIAQFLAEDTVAAPVFNDSLLYFAGPGGYQAVLYEDVTSGAWRHTQALVGLSRRALRLCSLLLCWQVSTPEWVRAVSELPWQTLSVARESCASSVLAANLAIYLSSHHWPSYAYPSYAKYVVLCSLAAGTYRAMWYRTSDDPQWLH